MKENWEIHWKDYYQILQVHPQAESEVVKVAYERLARKYHPDVNGNSATVLKMKDLNEAFEIIGNTEKRKRYDSVYHNIVENNNKDTGYSSNLKPSPEINPKLIRFNNTQRKEVKVGSFIIRNTGGPFKHLQYNMTNSWVKIIRKTYLNLPDKLPLKIEIEVQGDDWGKSYIDNFIVKLDDVETHVRIELTTLPEPIQPSENKRKTKNLFQYKPLKTQKLICIYQQEVATTETTIFEKEYVEVHPRTVLIENGLPYYTHKAFFLIRKKGNPIKKVFLNETPNWINNLRASIAKSTEQNELVLKVDFDVASIYWNKKYSTKLKIIVDDIESEVKIVFKTERKPP